MRGWLIPGLALAAAATSLVLGRLTPLSMAHATRLAALTAELAPVFHLFCNVFGVGARRELAWLAVYGASLAVALPLVPLLGLHLGLAGLLCWRAWRDPVVQLRRALVALAAGRMARANRAYGRYLMLGRSLCAADVAWLRRQLGDEVERLRSPFAGMVNACRYGDGRGLGDQAYRGLFGGADGGRASAEEG